jgi:3-hydroxyisobutyrate dehydrogenase-like beta-hydroxyacid dehydrogenase
MTGQTIGFIGLGPMGHGMALDLLKKGCALRFMAHRDRANLADLLAEGGGGGPAEHDGRRRAGG